METSRPYKAIPSPKRYEDQRLAEGLGSSEVAPIAAGAAAHGDSSADAGDAGRQGGGDQTHSISRWRLPRRWKHQRLGTIAHRAEQGDH